MNKKTKLATILICILLFSACGNNQRNSTISSSEEEKEAVTDAENPGIGIETAIPERDWKEVYEAVLHGDNPEQINYLERILPVKEEDGADTLIYHGVGLYDIDANAVPELFVFLIGNEWYSYDVYTCENDAAKLLLRSPAGSIEKATGILFNFGMDSYFTDDVAFRYDNGELIEIPDYAETLFGEGRYRLGNRIFELDSDEFFDISTFFDYEDAVNYFASGMTDNSIDLFNENTNTHNNEDANESYPEFLDMLHELRAMPCVAEVHFAIEEDGYQIDITLTENTDELDMKEVFECVQWGVAYRDGDRKVWERRLPIESLPDTVLRIYESSGEIAYDFLGSYTNPYDRVYTQYRYLWYANTWPEQETAFSFLFPEQRNVANQGTDDVQNEIPSINGVNIFNFHEDFDFLKPHNDINIGSHIQEVHEALGTPLDISASYGPTLNDDPYQDNFIYEEYGFCSVYYTRYYVVEMTFRQPGYGLMRGIRIGDNYEKVLDAFPRQIELADQRGDFGDILLYGADYWNDYYTGCMSIREDGRGNIIYVSGAGYIKFTIADGLVIEFLISYFMH